MEQTKVRFTICPARGIREIVINNDIDKGFIQEIGGMIKQIQEFVKNPWNSLSWK